MTDQPTRTEADAVGEIAARAAITPEHDVVVFDTGADALTLITPDGAHRHLIDLQPHEHQPRRARGTAKVHDATSFVEVLRQRSLVDEATDGGTILYADAEHHALVGIINDDGPDGPGWRDYRVELALRPTPEWAHWKAGQGLGEQERFALAIEAGEDEILDPPAGRMLEIAQTFHASIGSRFRQQGRLQDGQVQFLYEEDVEAKAGSNGDVVIPAEFLVEVAPFVGSTAVQVRARLRYRVGNGNLRIGYELVHPEKVEADAFDAVVAEVTAAAQQPPILGPAPSPATPIEVTVRAVS